MQSSFQHIYTDRTVNDNIADMLQTIPLIITDSLTVHKMNVADMDLFDKYISNTIAIVEKVKTRQDGIDYKIPLNYAEIVTNYFVPYSVGSAPKYTLRKGDDKIANQLKAFSDLLDDDSYPANIKNVMLDAAKYRVGYRLAMSPSPRERGKGRLFETSVVDPKTCFIVRENTVKKTPKLAVNYYEKTIYKTDGDIDKKVTVYNCWTNWHRYEFIYDSSLSENMWSHSKFDVSSAVGKPTEFDAYPLMLDTKGTTVETEIPLVEYLFRPDGKNTFEAALPLINAVNTLLSLSLDAANTKTDYVLKFRDIDLGTWEEEKDADGKGTGRWRNETLDNINRALAEKKLPVKSIQGVNTQPDVTVLEIPFDHTEIKVILDTLFDKIEETLSMPSRNITSGGQSTGVSANILTGGRSAYNMATTIAGSAVYSEGILLDVLLSISKQYPECEFKDLLPTHIQIQPMVKLEENIQVQTQSFATNNKQGMDRATNYEITGLSPDPMEAAKRDERYAEEQHKIEMRRLREKLEIEAEVKAKSQPIIIPQVAQTTTEQKQQ